jgi:hypothetical protein
MPIPHILKCNIYDPLFTDRFLLIGTCVERLHSDILSKFQAQWQHVVGYCLEQEHYNMLFAKLIDILALGKTKQVGFLTVDSSPHCIQMHYLSNYLARALKTPVDFAHFVVYEKEVYQIPEEAIVSSRRLATHGTPWS